MTCAPFFVSPARKVDVSHPKNVSEIKKIASIIDDIGNTKNGDRFEALNDMIPGMISANRVPKVMIPNVISIIALVFMPWYAIKLNIKIKISEKNIFIHIRSIGRIYCIAPTTSIAIVMFPVISVAHPIR